MDETGEIIPPRAFATAGRIRARTLTLIRWIAVAGQAAALMVVHFGLGFQLPIGSALATVAASVLVNLGATLRRPAGGNLDDRAAARYLAYDICQLAALLYLTGGLGNPFSFLLLAPVTVSATILSIRSTVALCALSLICVTVLARWHLALPWLPDGISFPFTYMLGVWVSLTVGILFFAGYAWRVAEEARRLHNALSATQLALDREQRVSEIGGLAAAAAHALGSPLGTIAIAAREIARELPEDSPIAEDARLLVSETIRCRDILAELAVKPRDEPESPFSLLPIGAVVEAAARRHQDPGVKILYDTGPEPEAAASKVPMTVPSAEIVHGLGSLIQNAVQFARTRTTVTTRWNDDAVSVTVADDGPGFPPMVLERLGEPYLSVRAEEGEHMGLGIFIAQTLLQRTGGTLRFRNLPVRGAEVSVRWRRRDLEGRPRQAEVKGNEGIA